MFARILACSRCNLRRKQVHNRSVFVGRPSRAVEPKETCAGALLTAEAARSIKETGDEPLESNGNLVELAAQLPHHLVNHAAADQSLAYRRIPAPHRPVRQQILDRYCQIVV